MSIIYTGTAVAQPVRTATATRQLRAIGPTNSAAVSGVTGALVGTASGVALAVATAGLVPAAGLGVLVAMGALFGSFNGGLIGLLSRLDGR